MEHTHLRLLPVAFVDGREDPVMVVDEGGDGVVRQGTDRVPAVAPQVVDDDIEFVGQK